MKAFRIRSKKFFLTYPKCNLGLNNILIQLQDKVKEKNITPSTLYVFSKEKHECKLNSSTSGTEENKTQAGTDKDMGLRPTSGSDSYHVHVFFELDISLDVTKSNFFDLTDPMCPEKIYHGHQESARKKKNVIRYILKSRDDPSTEILISKDLAYIIKDDGDFLSQSEIIIKLAEEGKIRKALEHYKKCIPHKYLQSANSVKRTLNHIYEQKTLITSNFKLEEFKVPKKVNDTFTNFFTSNNAETSIWFFGPSGQGKTQQIQALCDNLNIKYLVIKDLQAFKKFEVNYHELLIFDDFPLPKDINQIRDLFEAKSETGHRILQNFIFVRNCKRLFISNLSLIASLERSLPLHQLSEDEILSIMRRIQEIELKAPLFKLSEEEKQNHAKLRKLIKTRWGGPSDLFGLIFVFALTRG